MADVSILVLTLDEEKNLPGCLRSVAWADDVVVLDSGSTDRTVAIAERAGARVFHRRLDDWATHCDWAFRELPFRQEWVFMIDADERMSPALAREIEAFVRHAPADCGAARVRFKNMFQGRWIKHASLYPSWITRLLRRGRFRYEPRLVNAHPVVEGAVHDLRGHLVHYSFNKGIAHWFDKHNRYSNLEAVETLRQRRAGGVRWRDLLNSDPMKRRRVLKNLSMHLPARSLWKFLYMYGLRRGFLDGIPGLNYCLLQAVYEFMITLKAEEMGGKSTEDDVP
ncbi:MAG: glycosyltransferase family 2 protein [Candidatus Sumerlaeia bacterium]|nr:glycosyltransferase family 2 protein [Candidatus Sumerlaeia bacterium]